MRHHPEVCADLHGEDPTRLDAVDNELLEFLIETIAEMLPAVVDAERLARLRSYAQRTLEIPSEELPRGIRANRRRLKRSLQAWMPRVSFEEAWVILRVVGEPSAGVTYGLRPPDSRWVVRGDLPAR